MNRRKYTPDNVHFMDKLLRVLFRDKVPYNIHTLDDKALLVTWYGESYGTKQPAKA